MADLGGDIPAFGSPVQRTFPEGHTRVKADDDMLKYRLPTLEAERGVPVPRTAHVGRDELYGTQPQRALR